MFENTWSKGIKLNVEKCYKQEWLKKVIDVLVATGLNTCSAFRGTFWYKSQKRE